MKKFISMALALVMTLSLCTFVVTPKADAAFEDTGELAQYSKQAIDVIQTIQVMDGTSETEFAPAAGLTRQAAAKIICNMILGPATAKALPTNDNPFPDVAAGSTFAGYISYCKQQSIISGYSDNTFKGTEPLSGYAYLKMLLGALGYASDAEGFTGSNWKVNVAKIALGIDLNKGVPDDEDGEQLEGQITREAAAIYAFNTLQADMVEYEGKNTLEINGVKVSMGNGNAVPQTWNASSTSADNINAARSDGENRRPIVQFAERYFDKLRREPNGYHPALPATDGRYQNGRDEYTTDDFGRPSVRWFWKGVEIGTYSRTPAWETWGNVKVNAIYEALRENTGMSSGDDGAYLYINSNVPNNYELDVSRGNDKDLDHANNLHMDRVNRSATKGMHRDGVDVTGNVTGTVNKVIDGPLMHRVDRIGDGTKIEAFRNEATNHVDVCVISVYGGKVSSVRDATSKKDAYVTIDYANNAQAIHRPDTITGLGNNEYETEEFDEDDVVAYTYSDSANSIQSMYRMNSESGTLSSRIAEKSLTLDGELYSYGKEYTFNDMTEDDLSGRSSYVVYLDDNDFALWIEEDEFAVDQYVLLERITVETTSTDTTGKKVTTKTASVIDEAEPNAYNDGVNNTDYQRVFHQTKDAVGNSTWDAQAQVRLSSGSRRTVTLDDSKNYRTDIYSDYYALSGIRQVGNSLYLSTPSTYANGEVITDANGVVYVTDDNNNPVPLSLKNALTNNSGDGDGNWIAERFTAGHILRLTSTSSGYKLHYVDDKYFFTEDNFALDGKSVYTYERYVDNQGVVRYRYNTIKTPQGTNLLIDSETHFVVEDTKNGTYKSYVGSKNVPDININGNGEDVKAYIYHRGDLAKLIFITKANNVSSSSNEVLFLAANSTSNLVDSDDGYYYDVSAVEKNVVKTVRIKRGTTLDMDGLTFTPGGDNQNKEWRCVILNDVTYDSNDLLVAGSFDTDKVTPHRVQGIRRINDEEIRLNTNTNNSYLRDISEGAHIYFVDGSDIEAIEYDEIVNDNLDYAYYVEDDGVITYLFIVNYEPDNIIINYGLNTTRMLPDGFTVNVVSTTSSTVVANEIVNFYVYNAANNIMTRANIEVSLYAEDVEGNQLYSDGSPILARGTANDGGIWSVTIPDNLPEGARVYLRVVELAA